MKILNVGCGLETYGTHRIDIIERENVTKVYDIEKGIPFEDNLFDKVYCSYVWEHLKNPFELLKEMKRVCKVNGEIEIITDNAGYILTNLKCRTLHGNYYDINNIKDRHYALYTPEHLRNYFEALDLEIKESGFKFWNTVKTKKSIVFHKLLNTLFGERFAQPSIYIKGIK